jgi:hypothetical protein
MRRQPFHGGGAPIHLRKIASISDCLPKGGLCQVFPSSIGHVIFRRFPACDYFREMTFAIPMYFESWVNSVVKS